MPEEMPQRIPMLMLWAWARGFERNDGKAVDAFELSEIDEGTPFYQTVMNEEVRIA